ncbi:MAG: FkbM family methyltransferase [Candidatus Krumholzibacteriota bacterium]|nr:FkbM family methyltransferase [Candidatus Krumholzibacteriota bacterium]
MFKDYLKRKLVRYSAIYKGAQFVNKLWYTYEGYRTRKKCYLAYEKGERIIAKFFGGINVKYEAISPKNYWHLVIGSQHEDKFSEDLFNNYIDEGMVILDIGGHTGMYTVPLAIAVGHAGREYVIELDKKGFEAIQRNMQLNELDNVIPLKMVVPDGKGIVDFYIRPDKDTHSIFEATAAPSPLGMQETIQVEASTVDDMVKENIIQQPDFVKIDTEGAELKILNGMKNTVKYIKHILVEIHPKALKLDGILNPKEAIENKLQILGFNKRLYLDEKHILASRG